MPQLVNVSVTLTFDSMTLKTFSAISIDVMNICCIEILSFSTEIARTVCHQSVCAVSAADMYEVPDAVPLIHAVSYHVATDKDPYKFRSIFSDNLQPIATRGKIARGTLLVDIGCSSERAPPSVSYY